MPAALPLPGKRDCDLGPWTDHTVPQRFGPAQRPLHTSSGAVAWILSAGLRWGRGGGCCLLPAPSQELLSLPPRTPHSRCGLGTQTTSFSSPTKEVPLPLGEFLSWVSDVSKSWISSRGAPDSAAPRLRSSTQCCWMSIPTVLPAAVEPVPPCWGEVGQH
ncbi:unnamed protein product [Natator depressus]